jgi:hypothetical protein
VKGASPPPHLGLCADCRHAESVASKRSTFLRCRLADTDERFARYPRLPVLACDGYQRRSAAVEEPRLD